MRLAEQSLSVNWVLSIRVSSGVGSAANLLSRAEAEEFEREAASRPGEENRKQKRVMSRVAFRGWTHGKAPPIRQSHHSKVVWNPWDKKAKAMTDFGDEEYKHMICVEAGVIEKPITLKPGEEWKGRQELSWILRGFWQVDAINIKGILYRETAIP